MASNSTSGREELASILGIAVRHDGPVRLFESRSTTASKQCPGLFTSSKGKNGALIKDLNGTMLEEVLSHPRMVKLTKFGIETLLRNTPQKERGKLVAEASPLYRNQILLIWSKFATRGEEELLNKTVGQSYGNWFPDAKSESDLTEFREYLAQEIADSWNSAKTDETQQRLSHLLRIIGAKPLGKEDDTVKFSGLEHNPLEPLFPGDNAIVARQGWIFPKSPTPILLAKAEVRPESN